MTAYLVKGSSEYPIKLDDVKRALGIETEGADAILRSGIATHCIRCGVNGSEVWDVERNTSKPVSDFLAAANRIGRVKRIAEGVAGSRPDVVFHRVTIEPVIDKSRIARTARLICEWAMAQPEVFDALARAA